MALKARIVLPFLVLRREQERRHAEHVGEIGIPITLRIPLFLCLFAVHQLPHIGGPKEWSSAMAVVTSLAGRTEPARFLVVGCFPLAPDPVRILISRAR